jgi:energy-coupling factor transporter transmembrane protein EcfT
MRAPWHVLWGSGRGTLRALAPQTRIVCAAAAVAVCLTAPATSARGIAIIAAAVVTWLTLCRPPAAVVRTTCALGLVFLGPILLLTPLLRAQSTTPDWEAAASAPWAVFVRGLATMMVTVAAASTLNASELRQGMVRLPSPRIATLILLQVVQQTSTLLSETQRMAAALAVRGGSPAAGTALRMLRSLPRVWLPRVMSRADRVAAAMELRGFLEVELEAMGSVAAGRTDAFALAAAALAVAGSAALRLWGGG